MSLTKKDLRLIQEALQPQFIQLKEEVSEQVTEQVTEHVTEHVIQKLTDLITSNVNSLKVSIQSLKIYMETRFREVENRLDAMEKKDDILRVITSDHELRITRIENFHSSKKNKKYS